MLALIAFVLVFPAVGPRASDPKVASITWDGRFAKYISAYGLFADSLAQVPNIGLYEFDINTPLFSDYAQKNRFIFLPEGGAMTYREEGPFDLPVGSALVKSFSYPTDYRDPSKGRRLVETRLLIHAPDGWQGAAYVWNEDYSDATLKVAGATVPVDWIDARGIARHTDYLVPNMNQCKYCHRGFGQTEPLGLHAQQLNRPAPEFSESETSPGGVQRKPVSEPATNQLDRWTAMGILLGAPVAADTPRLAAWDDPSTGTIEQRALTYLDVNCAHCHNPQGLAGPTLLNFSLDEALVNRPGVYHRPTAAGNASRGRNFAIVPGNADASFLLTRLSSTHPFIRMPQIGRTVVHDEGVALIREWIHFLGDAASSRAMQETNTRASKASSKQE